MSTLSPITKVLFGAFAILVGSTFVTVESGCKQQKPRCSSGHGDFAAKYTVVSGPATCADLKGEMLGINSYNPPAANGNPDLDKATVAIQANTLGTAWDNADLAGLHDPDPNHKEYSLGAFTASEPTNDFCTVPALSDAIQDIPAVDENVDLGTTKADAKQLRYTWSNVKFYVTAANNGSQFTGDLVRTENGVACTYKVIGLFPFVDCTGTDPSDPSKSVPNNALCSSEADPDAAANRPTGSGISPDFPVVCDPDLLMCTLTKSDIPALK
jgi:hypothetical protein